MYIFILNICVALVYSGENTARIFLIKILKNQNCPFILAVPGHLVVSESVRRPWLQFQGKQAAADTLGHCSEDQLGALCGESLDLLERAWWCHLLAQKEGISCGLKFGKIAID